MEAIRPDLRKLPLLRMQVHLRRFHVSPEPHSISLSDSIPRAPHP